ncbi:MAG: hypothetical protein E6K89_03755 [Thaumarchaeota archaeon]|nr:MAG: hypothetical protein E6K89_03755 [Nitrososphaerota archaeon]
MVSQSILVLNKLPIVSLSVRIAQPSSHVPSDAGVTRSFVGEDDGRSTAPHLRLKCDECNTPSSRAAVSTR